MDDESQEVDATYPDLDELLEKEHTFNCAGCGNKFNPRTWKQEYCSVACRKIYYHRVNKEIHTARNKAWRLNNKGKAIEIDYNWKRKNPEKVAVINRRCKLKKQYGLTLDYIKNLEIRQEHKCLICKKERKLVIDHCHNTGKFRGLICNPCNTGIGSLEENTETMLNAIKYIKYHNGG